MYWLANFNHFLCESRPFLCVLNCNMKWINIRLLIRQTKWTSIDILWKCRKKRKYVLCICTADSIIVKLSFSILLQISAKIPNGTSSVYSMISNKIVKYEYIRLVNWNETNTANAIQFLRDIYEINEIEAHNLTHQPRKLRIVVEIARWCCTVTSKS